MRQREQVSRSHVRLVQVVRLGQPARLQLMHEQRIFRHREAMVRAKAGVVARMVDDLQRHANLSGSA